MRRFHPLDPNQRPTVTTDPTRKRLVLDIFSIGGDVEEFDLGVEEAARIGRCLLEAVAMIKKTA